MTRDEYFQLAVRVNANNTCLAQSFDAAACSGNPINSHSIARISQLSKLASPDGKVLIWEREGNEAKFFHMLDENCGILDIGFREFPIRKTSVFKGFCNHHDTSLFNLIDQPISVFSNEVILQLHYRAICFEYFHKKKSVELFHEILKDGALSDEQYDFLDEYNNHLKLGLKDLQQEKDICERNYPTANSSGDVKAAVFEFNTAK